MFNVLFATDTSDDAFEATRLLSQIIDPHIVDRMKVLLLAWPERMSPLWDRALDMRLQTHDMHEAVARVVADQLGRFERVFERHDAVIEGEGTSGDPVRQVLRAAEEIKASTIVLAITGGGHAQQVRALSMRIVEASSIPVLVLFGTGKISG
jgi:AcrR family transcriptional regulator